MTRCDLSSVPYIRIRPQIARTSAGGAAAGGLAWGGGFWTQPPRACGAVGICRQFPQRQDCCQRGQRTEAGVGAGADGVAWGVLEGGRGDISRTMA